MSISCITVLLSSLALIAYIREGIKKANKISSFETYFTVAMEGGHVVIWIVVAVLYRVGKTGHDLWGWACSPLAIQIQPNFQGVVDFDQVCKRSVSFPQFPE